MPILTVQLAAVASDALATAVAQAVHRLTAEHLNKQADLTAVVVDFVAPERWFIAGQPLSQTPQSSGFVHLRITEGSNTPEQISCYLAAVHAALHALLPAWHPVGYVQVDQIPAWAWGWGGRSQADRAAQRLGQPSPALGA